MNGGRSSALAWWSAVTILVSAFLLFQVQPVISKKILPWFGGSPAVWTTCVLFFQLLLLGGYAYAHWLIRYVPPRWQGVVHIAILVVAVADPADHAVRLLEAAGRQLSRRCAFWCCWRRKSGAPFSCSRRPARSCRPGSPALSRPLALSPVRPFQCRLAGGAAHLSLCVRDDLSRRYAGLRSGRWRSSSLPAWSASWPSRCGGSARRLGRRQPRASRRRQPKASRQAARRERTKAAESAEAGGDCRRRGGCDSAGCASRRWRRWRFWRSRTTCARTSPSCPSCGSFR